MSALQFEIKASDGAARSGVLHLPRGAVETPAFMPVGTAGTVKAMLPENVAATGARIVLGNTYHLMLRPGAERIARLGGLHKFMDWPFSILTDSGGFQVMSLSALRDIRDEGVRFRSHIDGSEHFLSPERAMEIQDLLGSDIQMVLDECAPFPASRERIESSLALSMRWAARSKAAFRRTPGRFCFGIVQGGVYPDLRLRSAEELMVIGFDGYALGGLAVGEGQSAMLDVIAGTAPGLPPTRPRYLMGVGKPDDIIGATRLGIDLFDCVLPTRSGRNGQAFTWAGAVNLRNARFADDSAPLDADCSCACCQRFSRAYLHHVVKSGEIIASMLLTSHNLFFFQDLLTRFRAAVVAEETEQFCAGFLAGYRNGQTGEPA
ncbi:MAG TPA: tRNA guanosine(34) transglycosylase Tgt [Micropepsaceae bacterium]|nr:tRNA guanosine(34) transglycosylase Tgt [Micropepsaceae bacterium]